MIILGKKLNKHDQTNSTFGAAKNAISLATEQLLTEHSKAMAARARAKATTDRWSSGFISLTSFCRVL